MRQHRSSRIALALVATICSATPALAQTPLPTPGDLYTRDLLRQSYERVAGALRDPGAAFFQPELVMQHQQRIGLTADQRAAIIRAMQAAQQTFIDAQWQMEPAHAALAEVVSGPRVDQQRVLQQIDRILEIERRIKRTQIELLVQIKNVLTEEQQTELTRLGGARHLLQGQSGPTPFIRR